MSEQRFVEWACHLASARRKLAGAVRLCLTPHEPDDPSPASPGAASAVPGRDHLPLLRTIENRVYMLEAATIGTDVARAIPLPPAAQVRRTRPPTSACPGFAGPPP